MSFHLGKPILVLLAIALVSGAVIAFRPPPRKAELTVWVFADAHYKTLSSIVPEFEKRENVKVNLSILNQRAEDIRLMQSFMADPTSRDLPDLCEIVIGSIGRYFRPPLKDVGFVPLDEYLDRSGWRNRIVEQRFTPWSKEGVIFGAPHDVHPCGITYREDLYRKAGIDLSACRTWPQLHVACEKFRDYWRSKGFRYRHAIELPEASAEYLIVMLLQRGINPVDDHGNVYLEDPRLRQTLALYATMVAGPRKVGAQAGQGMGAFVKDVNDGNLCAFITPDWRLSYFKDKCPSVEGLLRVMPMPVFDAADKPTSTHGGTCMAMTRACKNRELAWKLIEFVYYSEDGLRARLQESQIIPPVPEMWMRSEFHQPDPYFGNQKALELMTELAPQIPRRIVTPMTNVAGLAMNNALVNAVQYVKTRGTDGLEGYCQEQCKEVADELRRRMKQMEFE